MNDKLYCCKLRDDSGGFEAAAELLETLNVDFSSWENREEHTIYHTVYATDEAAGRRNFETLREAVETWKEYGVELGGLEYFELNREDWAEVWKQYFPVLAISERLIVKPSWREYSPRPGQAVVDIDPGMSFGTGQHATTSFCLSVIDRLAGTPGMNRLLDAGCGSGILAIAGVKLGYRRVDAFDYDPDAVRVAAENFARNGIAPETLTPTVADAAVYQPADGPCDLVAANILGHLLKAYKLNIAGWVRPGGCLALAGILSGEFDALAAEYTALGFAEVERRTEKEWTSGLFRKPER